MRIPMLLTLLCCSITDRQGETELQNWQRPTTRRQRVEASTETVCSGQHKNKKYKCMALAVQTKPRSQGSDPDTRMNSKLQKASVLHANTILTLDLQQELSSRTRASSSVVEFSLGDDLRMPFSGRPVLLLLPLLLLLLLLVFLSLSPSSSSTDRCWFAWQVLGPSRGSKCRNPSDWVGS